LGFSSVKRDRPPLGFLRRAIHKSATWNFTLIRYIVSSNLFLNAFASEFCMNGVE